MREPTEAMVEAGHEHIDVGLGTDPSPAWRAMVDAALK
jgi:hypothetical protein